MGPEGRGNFAAITLKATMRSLTPTCPVGLTLVNTMRVELEGMRLKTKVLVVDDDEALAEMIGIVLNNDGFETYFCYDGGQANDMYRSVRPDLVLLDLMLPGKDGIEILRELRKESDTPVVMLTAKSETADVVRGLEAGADDYVPKPFKPAEFVARVRARLRETDSREPETLQIADLTIDVAGNETGSAA